MDDLVAKPGTKSVVWQTYGLRKKGNGDVVDDETALCRSFRRNVSAKNGYTSNLLAHLRIHHCKLYGEVTALMKSGKSARETRGTPTEQPRLSTFVETSQLYEKRGRKWKKLTESVTYFLAKDSQPMYNVEKPGFCTLLQSFDGRYKLPSRKYFSETAIPSLYSNERAKLLEKLSRIAVHFSATTDLWSSAGLKPYISYTIHFINANWKLQSKCLQTHYLPGDHTSEILADSLTTTMDLWTLKSENQVCITNNSGSNIVKATRDLKWPRLSCIGHILHLAITKSMDHESRCHRALGLCRKIVSAFHCSWK